MQWPRDASTHGEARLPNFSSSQTDPGHSIISISSDSWIGEMQPYRCDFLHAVAFAAVTQDETPFQNLGDARKACHWKDSASSHTKQLLILTLVILCTAVRQRHPYDMFCPETSGLLVALPHSWRSVELDISCFRFVRRM